MGGCLQRGITLNRPPGALAHLSLARAYALSGDTAKARTAYHDFFALWKDADPDIPILKEAKAEYEQLQTKLLGRFFLPVESEGFVSRSRYPRSRFCLKTAPTHWHQEGVRWSFLPRSTSE